MLARRLSAPLRIYAPIRSACKASRASPLFALSKPHLPRLEPARPFFDGAKSLFGRSKAEAEPFPVVLLAGFLGAGKTTVLEQLLRQKHGFKLGIIVNDLASVNVDANVLRDAISTSGSKSVSLENGCVCCTAADDLKESVQSLLGGSGSRDLDAVVVELSGVAEPARAARILEAPAESSWLKKSLPLSVRTVTVVDSPAFATDYLREHSPHEHHAHSAADCDERYGTLLAEQVEYANLLLLNKADQASRETLGEVQAMVQALNETADIRITEYGKIDVAEFLAVDSKRQTDSHDAEISVEAGATSSVEEAAPVKSCCAAKTCSATNEASSQKCESEQESKVSQSRAETRFGITSFVYTTERMMSRVKLLKQFDEWQKARERMGNKLTLHGLNNEDVLGSTAEAQTEAGRTANTSPLASVLRSKGILLLDANPEVAFYWSHAGKSINFSVFGPWPENASRAQGGFGPRRTELVFIGVGFEERRIRELLNSCLCTDDDLEFLKKR